MLKINNYSNSILNSITFSLESGKDLIILGSNGVGKTTLAKVLCGITPTNSVTINGINLSKTYGKRRTKLINYTPPKLEVFDEFITVKEFLELGNSNLKIKAVLEILHISHLSNKTCKTLSSGESQLLLIASALLHNALYSIFDEPTSNLDPKKIQLLFKLLKDKSILKSKIIITHNLDLAYKLGYDILFLKDGNIHFYDTSHNFFTQENLDMLYDGSVEKQAHNIVIKL